MTTYKDIDYILEHLPDNFPYKGVVKRVLIQAPAADVKPNIKGYWIKTGYKFICYSCSECGYDIEKTKFNYCPNCGAKMTMTNGDRIRAMTDEELAEYLCHVENADYSYVFDWLYWLEQGVKDG